MNPNDSIQAAEVKSEVVFLGKLLERVVDGKMLVPLFQRQYVWRHQDMLALLESVLKGYPIGSLLVWETSQQVSCQDRVGPILSKRKDEGLVALILDGHQRVATLLGTLMFSNGTENPQHGVDWRVYCDLKNMEFCHARTGLGPQHFPVNKLLSTAGYLEACRNIQKKVSDEKRAGHLLKAADDLANAFRNFQLPLISVIEGDMDTAAQVFSLLNRTGRKMSKDQMVSALTYRENEFHLDQRLDDLLEKIGHNGFGEVNRIFPLRVVLAAMGLDIYTRDLARQLTNPDIQKKLPASMDIAENSIDIAIRYLHRWGVTSDRLLPYGLQLVFLADFFRICPSPAEDIETVLQRWFWVTSFTGWFGGVNSTQANLDLEEIRKLATGERNAFSILDLDEPAQPFPKRFDTRSARVRTFLIYLASLSPEGIEQEDKSGVPIDPGRDLSELGPRALAYVVGHGLPDELQSSPANRMFVSRNHQGQAFTALKRLDERHLPDVLKSHGFPSEEALGHLERNDREAFVHCRLRHLIEGEREFMKLRCITLPQQEIMESLADSDVSEDD